MKDIIRQVLKEEVVIRNTNVDIFEHSYVTNVLGINIPLNESYPYSEELRKRILQEQLIFEGFWDDLKGKVKDMSKDAIKFYSAFKTVLSDPTTINSWMKSVETKVINEPLRKIRKFLTYLKEQMDGWDMPDFVKMVDNISKTIDDLVKKVYSHDGWKGALLITGLGLTIKWVWNKVGGLVENGIDAIKSFMVDDGKAVKLEEFTSWFRDVVVGKLIDLVKDQFNGFMGSIASSLTGIGGFIDWAKKAFDGLKFVLDTFGGAVYRFTRRQSRPKGEKIGNIQL